MKRILMALVAVGFGFWISIGSPASGQTPPVSGRNYYSAQFPERPPLPANMLAFPEAEISPGVFLLDDLNFDYTGFQQQALLLNAIESAMDEGPPLPGEGQPGEGGTNWVDSSTARTFVGSCTGHLLTPVYQETNLVLSLTGTTSGDKYDLYTATNLSVTNWTYLGRWTNLTAPWTIFHPATNESYYFVACVDDADGEGLPDVYEAAVTHTDMNDPDTDYDGRNDYEELVEATLPLDNTSFTPARLGYFRFNDGDFTGERGQQPVATSGLQSVDAWITKGVQLTNGTAVLKYRTVEADGRANINLRSGTLRWWFKPQWNSGTGTGAAGKLLEVGSRGAATTNGWWSLFFDATGNTLNFVSQTNNTAEVTNLMAGVTFTSNRWCQVVLTYTNGAVALYTNGVLCATNSAGVPYPLLAARTNGFTIGCSTDGGGVVQGVFEDLETFNYPLTASEVLESFQLTQPPMLIPNLRLWLKADQGVQKTGNKVSTWNDQSGNANDASQGAGNSQPLFATNAIGGKEAIFFAGTNYFSLPNTIFSGATEAEGFTILKATTNTPVSNRGLWQLSGVGSRYPNQSGTIAESLASSGATTTPKPAISIAEPHLFNSGGKTNFWFSRLNGVTHFTRNNNTVQFETTAPFIGNGAGTFFDGQIGEILTYTRVLNDYERVAVENYLSQRYNLLTNAVETPSQLAAFAVSTNQISLTWSNNLGNTNTTFLVQRAVPGGVFSNVALLRNILSFLDTDLNTGTTYSYRIKALNCSGDSALSVVTNVTTLSSGLSFPLASLKLWVKADGGHGAGAVNCWADQTTNNNSLFFDSSKFPAAPLWGGFTTNGHPVVAFWSSNALLVPPLLASASQGEVMIVLRSFGRTDTNWASLWWMSADSVGSRYPFTNGYVWDNFGRYGGVAEFDSGLGTLANLHLFNPMAKSGEWSAAFNNGSRVTKGNTLSFPTDAGYLGRGASVPVEYLRGEVAEWMIFNRELNQAERDALKTNYFNKRYNLW